MFGITDLGTYIIGAIAIVLLPGPNSMYCLAMAGKYGARAAYCAVAGIFLGDSVLMLLSSSGATSIIKTIPVLFLLLKLAGGLYLFYLGWQLLRSAARQWNSRQQAAEAFRQSLREPDTADKPPSAHHLFQRALLLSLLNPKAILFFLAFFVQFVDPHYAYPAFSFLLLAIILQICSLTYLSVLIFSGLSLVKWFRHYQRLAAGAVATVGLMFIAFALKLWTASID
ncbi:leucine efflux protein LeuE [Snodgrassella sp. ESL0253]|uniref:leucine efflux protein LeuE n=1 Tax=Snodgrassella sp. ESL0253 TaxID=2705031 RepID=UPI0015828BF9|nr:leucine efflux protein LeuE [Snodgrassella sp. ESL0253]NUE65754.1 leucine efflux protein LeuE [Snodgrassella sp. ESL0253]